MSDNTNEYQVLLDVVRQNYASVVWTHKIQIKQADIYATRYRRLENFNVILAAANIMWSSFVLQESRFFRTKDCNSYPFVHYNCRNNIPKMF